MPGHYGRRLNLIYRRIETVETALERARSNTLEADVLGAESAILNRSVLRMADGSLTARDMVGHYAIHGAIVESPPQFSAAT